MNTSAIPDKTSISETFMEMVARYYSQFIDTDFKKGRLPKRRIESKDRKGRRVGVTLSQFPSMSTLLKQQINTESKNLKTFTVSKGRHVSELPETYKYAIDSQIEQVDTLDLITNLDNTIRELTDKLKPDTDPEIFREQLIETVHRELTEYVILPFVDRLTSYFEEHSSSAINPMIELDQQISDFLIEPLMESSASAITELVIRKEPSVLLELVEEHLNPDNIQQSLHQFFQDFIGTDLYQQVRDMDRTRSLQENYDFYLYLGEVRYKKNTFPIFYIPLEFESKSAGLTLKLSPRIFINKKAIEYVIEDLRRNNSQLAPMELGDRILYLDESESPLQAIKTKLPSVLRSLGVEESLGFDLPDPRQIKTALFNVNDYASFAIFDKSDESMVNDYEALLHDLEIGSDLRDRFGDLIDKLILQNPVSVDTEIEREWDENELSERLIFESPVPLAEEQRRILSALKKEDARFIVVEGPPGTGKSHTIAAIAFDQILNNKNLLILSDKTEALNVVEKFLNETLEKVRVGDDFQNPILRLGKQGTNYGRLLRQASVDNIKVQLAAAKQHETRHAADNKQVLTGLTEAITKTQKAYGQLSKIPFDQYSDAEDDLLNYIDTDEIEEIIQAESAIPQLRTLDKVLQFVQYHQVDLEDAFEEAFTPNVSSLKDLTTLLDLAIKWKDEKPLIAKYESLSRDMTEPFMEFSSQLDIGIETRRQASQSIERLHQRQDGELERRTSTVQRRQQEENRSPILRFFFRNNVLEETSNTLTQIQTNLSEITNDMSAAERQLSDAETLLSDTKKQISDSFPEYDQLSSDELRRIGRFLKELDDDLNSSNIADDAQFEYLLFLILNEANFLISELDRNHIAELDELFKQNLCPLPHFTGDLSDPDLIDDLRAQIDALCRLQPLHQQIENAWRAVPDIDYLGEKRKIELYNTQKFATQIDNRMVEFLVGNRADAKILQEILRKKSKFPTEKFAKMQQAFPCIIAGLRDYAEFIPLQKEMFDLIIIDEGSQVSIAQALPAILRAKQMIVLGDKQQFSNVKTTNSSKELNNTYMNNIMERFLSDNTDAPADAIIRARRLDIHNSVMDFFELTANSVIRLKKHFRSYPELISFSSRYFYENGLQPMKVRVKPISDTIEFREIDHDGLSELTTNTNQLEAEAVIAELESLVETDHSTSVGVITPHTAQQELIWRMVSDHPLADLFLQKLSLAVFTFDTCQGEERDVIIYSMVATKEKDRLNYVFPRSLDGSNDEELDGQIRLQRLNVGFSRAKEKILIIHSKPIEDFNGSIKRVLQHYSRTLESAKDMPGASDFDEKSPQEEVLFNYLISTPFYQENRDDIEIKPQFPLGEYLGNLDKTYTHSNYVVDFLIVRHVPDQQTDQYLILEYDGAQWHFDREAGINAGNWELHLSDSDIEREKILESFGYKMLRVNKFNIGSDPVTTLDNRIRKFFDQLSAKNNQNVGFTQTQDLKKQMQSEGTRTCKKCGLMKPMNDFYKAELTSKYGRHCNQCRSRPSRANNNEHKPSKTQRNEPFKTDTEGKPICPVKASHGSMKLRTRARDGKPFWGCAKFPRCRQTFDVTD